MRTTLKVLNADVFIMAPEKQPIEGSVNPKGRDFGRSPVRDVQDYLARFEAAAEGRRLEQVNELLAVLR